MALLSERDQNYLRDAFGKLPRRVRLLMFTQEHECQYCKETRQIVEELAGLSDKVEAEVVTFEPESPAAQQYGIDKIPAIVVLGLEGDDPVDYGIRFFGIPSGYEFSTLVEDILMVGQGETELAESTKAFLRELDRPVHIQVFVTPTCPYCPRAVYLAHQMAFESPQVTADMVEAIEFPHLAQKYSVMGVPRTVINEDVHIEGAVPESMLLAQLQEALRDGQPSGAK